MWIAASHNRLVNMERIDSIELVSRRESTAQTMTYEVIARMGGGQAHLVLARYDSEAAGRVLIQAVKDGLLSELPLLVVDDISPLTAAAPAAVVPSAVPGEPAAP